MLSDNYFLERETSRYHIVAVGEDRENAFVTLQSKTSGLAIFHFSAKHSDMQQDTEGLEWWVEFLEKAESLDGDLLDEHLMTFVPITQLDSTAIPGLVAYSSPRHPNLSNKSMITLATMLDAGIIQSNSDIRSISNAAKEIFSEHLERHRHDDKFAASQTLVSAIANLESSLRQYGDKAFRHQYILDRIGDFKKSGLFDDLSSVDDKQIVYRFVSSLHESHFSNNHETRREIELSSAAELPRLPVGHPYHKAVKKMVKGSDCLINDDILDASGWFGGAESLSAGNSPYPYIGSPHAKVRSSLVLGHTGVRKGGGVHALAHLLRCNTPEEKRNLFQSFQAFDFQSGALKISSREDFYEFSSGKPISQILWKRLSEFAFSGDKHRQLERSRFGKKDTALMIHNMKALNNIAWWGKEGTIKTLAGESLSISPYSREEQMSSKDGVPKLMELDSGLANYSNESPVKRRECQYAKITMNDKNGNQVFEGNYDFNMHNVRGLGEIESESMAFNLMNLPMDTIACAEHMEAIRAVMINPSLNENLVEGGILLRDKKIKKSEMFNGPWKSITHQINVALKNNPELVGSSHLLRKYIEENKILQVYENSSFVYDSEAILSKVTNAVVASYLVDVESRYSDLDELLESDGADDHVVFSHGYEFHLSDRDSLQAHNNLFYNAKIDLSHKVHSNYSSLKKSAGPDAKVSWEPALPPTTIEIPGQPPIVIDNLCSYTDISAEGSEMSHCLASYAGRCMRGEYLAFSVTQDGKKIATLGMEANGESDAEFDQLQGHGNGAVDPIIHRAVMDRFVTPLEEDGEVNEEPLEINTPDAHSVRLSGRQLLSLQMDFEVHNEEKMQRCRDYLSGIISPEDIVEVVERKLDAQIMTFDRTDDEVYDCEDHDNTNFTFERRQIEESRQKLYRDFGVERKLDCESFS